MYKLWETLEEAKKLKWVELSHSLNNESHAGLPDPHFQIPRTVRNTH